MIGHRSNEAVLLLINLLQFGAIQRYFVNKQVANVVPSKQFAIQSTITPPKTNIWQSLFGHVI